MDQVSEIVTPDPYFPFFLCYKPLIFSLELGYLELRLFQTPLQLDVIMWPNKSVICQFLQSFLKVNWHVSFAPSLPFLHLVVWNAAVMAGILAAILDHEDKMMEQWVGRSLGHWGLHKTFILTLHCLPQDFYESNRRFAFVKWSLYYSKQSLILAEIDQKIDRQMKMEHSCS